MADDLIVSDPAILGGQPHVRGTRLSVKFLCELAASGASDFDICEKFPQLSSRMLQAAWRYAAAALVGMIDNAPEDMAEQHKRYLYGVFQCHDYQPDHNGECLNCDEPIWSHIVKPDTE